MEENRGIWKGIGNKTNEDFDGRMKQMWVEMKGYWANKQERETRGYILYVKSTKR